MSRLAGVRARPATGLLAPETEAPVSPPEETHDRTRARLASKVPGEAPAGGDDSTAAHRHATGLVRPARQALAADQLTPAARAVMHEVLADLQRRPRSPPTRQPASH